MMRFTYKIFHFRSRLLRDKGAGFPQSIVVDKEPSNGAVRKGEVLNKTLLTANI